MIQIEEMQRLVGCLLMFSSPIKRVNDYLRVEGCMLRNKSRPMCTQDPPSFIYMGKSDCQSRKLIANFITHLCLNRFYMHPSTNKHYLWRLTPSCPIDFICFDLFCLDCYLINCIPCQSSYHKKIKKKRKTSKHFFFLITLVRYIIQLISLLFQ